MTKDSIIFADTRNEKNVISLNLKTCLNIISHFVVWLFIKQKLTLYSQCIQGKTYFKWRCILYNLSNTIFRCSVFGYGCIIFVKIMHHENTAIAINT